MKLRAIEESDIWSCAELFAVVFSSEPWNEPWSKEKAHERLAHFYNSRGFVGMLGENRGLTSFALGNIEPFHSGSIFYLREMCTATASQGRGAGSHVYVALERALRLRQVKSIYLATGHGVPAAGFYAKNGFRRSEEMAFYGKTISA